VKTTSDLLLLRSDVYEVGDDGRLTKVTDPAPLVELDSGYYKTITAFEQRFRSGAPSLKDAVSLTVNGDWTFESGVRVRGTGVLKDEGEPRTVAAGTEIADLSDSY
jgi:UTP--glucose-1-phosphate uridylyltransferase